jgi:hypothetical protein
MTFSVSLPPSIAQARRDLLGSVGVQRKMLC